MNKKSIFAFAASVLALCICWFFWIPWYGIVICLIAIALSFYAIAIGKRIKKNNFANDSLMSRGVLRNAKYAVVMGYLGIILSLIFIVFAIIITVIRNEIFGSYF